MSLSLSAIANDVIYELIGSAAVGRTSAIAPLEKAELFCRKERETLLITFVGFTIGWDHDYFVYVKYFTSDETPWDLCYELT